MRTGHRRRPCFKRGGMQQVALWVRDRPDKLDGQRFESRSHARIRLLDVSITRGQQWTKIKLCESVFSDRFL